MTSSASKFAIFWGVVVTLVILMPGAAGQSTGGRVLGRISDPTGAVLFGVKVVLTNEATGVARDAQTNSAGVYEFVAVSPGSYQIEAEQAGFKKELHRGIALDVNQVVTLNLTLQLGEAMETVEVTTEPPLVDTTSTQLGAVVNDRSVSQLPLNERDTYQFLQLQPGVQSQLGSSGSLFYGSDQAGSVSVNGGRGRANNFSVNGGDANDQFVNLPTVEPSPDAIQEFRVLTNTFDAEYGRNSGAVVNVITKSGTNDFHGNLYEFFRNKVLNARGFFDTEKPAFNQNQFGGTFGGPIKKNRSFFFVSYEGRRIRQGQSGDTVAVPSVAERGGNFSAGSQFSGSITDPFVASVLNGRPGCTAAIQAIPGAKTPAVGLSWSQVFPTNVIPSACQDPVAVDLLRFVPLANRGQLYQGVPTGSDRQDQMTARWDHTINDRQNFSAYYYFTDEDRFQPFAFFQAAGADVPGFGSLIGQRYQQWNLSHAWTVSNTVLNQARFTYTREGLATFQHPQRTNLVTDSCASAAAVPYCFTGLSDSSAINALPGAGPKFGITPNLGPDREGVPFLTVSGGFVIGNNYEGEIPQIGNIFQWSDNLSWVKGAHTFEFGADARRQRFDMTPYYNVSGDFTIVGSGLNSVGFDDQYPDYLLGLVDTYYQGSAQVEDIRSTSLYLFAQDSWKIKPNLTLNYGLRWELDTPPADISDHIQTFRPGQRTQIYPCQLSAASIAAFQSIGVVDPTCANTGVFPTGLVVAGDQGVPQGMTQTYYKAFAPRIGIAWSPGSSGATSIRAGWGIFYNPIEQLVLEQSSAAPPYGGSTFLSNTFFNTPFVGQSGTVIPNPFNGFLNPPRGQPIDWSTFRPISLFGAFQPHMRTQYTDQYNLTVQHEIRKDLLFQIGYVGSQGHRLLAAHDIDPGTPQTCLDLISILGAGACGPFGSDSSYFIPGGTVLPVPLHLPYGPQKVIPAGTTVGPAGITLVGLRPYSSPSCNPLTGAGCPPDGVEVFGSIFSVDTIANSSYNSLQTMLEKRFAHGLQLQAAYTFSKSLDWTSSFEESLNPFNFPESRSLSLFDSRHRFVVNYVWELPIPKKSGVVGQLIDGWTISGITQFQSGFPIRLQTQDDYELISSLFFAGTFAPQQIAPFQILDPRSNPNNYYFNPSGFADPPLGTISTTRRTICCGPGTNNWDLSVQKNIGVDKSRYFQFRTDFFNVANHTQFFNPDGNFSDGASFGRVKSARDPRLLQLALKFYF